MQNRSKKCYFVFALFFISFYFSSLCYSAHTEVYMNTTLGISMHGPSDWYLEKKDNPSPEANYLFQRDPQLYALFSKYSFKNKTSWPNPIGSTLLLYLFPPTGGTALSILNHIISLRNTQGIFKVLEAPHEVTFNNQIWAVMVSRAEGPNISIYEIDYVTVYSVGSVFIEATFSNSDYAENKKIVDKIVSQVILDTNQDSLVKKTTLLYLP